MKLSAKLNTLTAFACSMISASALAGSISTGDFSAWEFNSTGTATVTLESSGGSPAERLNITTVSGSIVYGTAIKSDFSTTNLLSGESYTLGLDVLSGPGAYGAGQAIQLLVEQNGAIYGTFLGTTGVHSDWSPSTFSGTFSEGSFSRLLGTGSATPDFSGNTLTRFGFAGGNEGSGTLTQYYDNFSLTSAAIAPVPEPETYALMLAGLGLLGFAAKRRNCPANRANLALLIPPIHTEFHHEKSSRTRVVSQITKEW